MHENESSGYFLKMYKNGQKCLKTSWKSTEWGTKFPEIRKFPENSQKFPENSHACISHCNYSLNCLYLLNGFRHKSLNGLPLGSNPIYWCTYSGPCNVNANVYIIALELDWRQNGTSVSPMENLWPSTVHNATPQWLGSCLASWGMYDATYNDNKRTTCMLHHCETILMLKITLRNNAETCEK